jgi:PAS domain S-box-containing protein
MGILRKRDLLSSISKRKETILGFLGEEILIIDAAYKIVYANQKFLEKKGKSLNEVIGRYCHQVTHDLDKPCHMSGQSCPLNEAMRKQAADKVVHTYEDKDKKRYFEITASSLTDKKGNLQGIIELFRDITETEREKRESEEKYRNLIERSNDAIAILQDNRVKLFNQKLTELTGYSREELQEADFREGIAPEFRELLIDRYSRRQKGEEVPDNYQFTLLTKNGQKKEVEAGVALIEYQGKIASYCFLQDVTEKKKAEDELRKVKDYLDNIISTSQVAITVVDNQGDFSIFNQGAERLTGYEAEEIIGRKKVFDFYADKKELEHIQRRLQDSGLIENFETRLLKKDGSQISVNISVSLLRDQEGNPIGSIGISSDITERKKAEIALRESEERLNAIIENSPDVAIQGYDINGNIISWNNAAERLFGWKQDEVLGKSLDQLILDKESAGEFHKILKELDDLNNPSSSSEWKCQNKEGVELTVYSTIFPIPSSGGSKEFICMDIDITQRKKTEETIRYLQEFNQEIVEKLPLGVLRLDREGSIVYENPKMGQIMGVEKGGKSRAIGMKVTQMPNVAGSGLARQMETLLAGTPFTYQIFPFVSLYGKKTTLSANGVPLFDSQGDPDGAILLIEDVTESKKIEQKIIQANRELSALNAISSITNQSLNLDLILNETLDKVLEVTDCQAGGIYILNQADRVLELKACKGLSSEAVKEVDKLKPGEGFSGRIVSNGEPITVEDINQDPRLTRLVMKKEGLHSYLGVPLKSKGKILGTLFVITQQDRTYNSDEIQLLASIGNQIGMAVENAYLFREAEQWIVQLEAIRNITNRLNKLNDVKTVASAVMDEIKKVIDFDNCRVFLLNENREELIPIAFGSEVEEYKDETEEVLRLKVGEGITGWVARTGEGQVVDDGERHPRCRHIPGTPYVDESIMASPMIYEGVVRGVITLSKLGLKRFNQNHLALLSILANEAVVAIENAKLFEGLKQAYAKLKEAQEKLVQAEKLRALGEMAGGVAHDFNNLLGAILGRAQLLLLSAKEQDIRKGLKVIEKAALDGAETVRRIQEFTRLRTDENFVLLDLNEILKESLEITKHKWKDEAQKKGILIQVEADLDKDLPETAGNPSELREVFVNMILNSIDAMPRGGTLSISSRSEGNHVLAQVKDTGVGMPEEVQKKVFDPFFTTKGPKGNGLGMSLAYGIIIRHNGEISIESQEGKGTTFSVRLSRKSVQDGKGAKEKKPEETRNENILIIDDEPAIRELLCDILQSRGYKAVAVDDSLKGIELFEKEEFDIVFTDLSMPEMSGWEVTDRLKFLNPEVVIVMVTGWGTQVDSRKLKDHAVDLLMAKPFEVKKLFEILNDAQKIKKKGVEKEPDKVDA